MKYIYFFIFFIWGTLLQSQEYLAPLSVNEVLHRQEKPIQLSPRGADTVNYNPIWVNPNIPFYDEFSSDLRRPRDIKTFSTGAISYFRSGLCVDYKHYNVGQYQLSTVQTFLYQYDATKPPLYVDSTSTSFPPILISVNNDTPNCSNTTLDTYYPPTFRKYYDINGTEIYSEKLFDTVLTLAGFEDITLKNYLWIDRHAYFNKHIAYMPPSKGTATLDGLNEFGRPYDTVVLNAYGAADYLTSAPINLSGLNFGDSLYLSFMYQPQGYGDWPDKQDSLVVEFKDDEGDWNQMWVKHGLSSEQSLDTLEFKHALIQIPLKSVASDPFYFFDSFQFRFRNYATISGNNDHWHIDYVKLDKNRNYQDTVIKDANFVYELPTVLKNYTMMPAKQYQGNNDLKDTLFAINRNIGFGSIFSTYKYICDNVNDGTTYGSNTAGIPYRADPLVYLSVEPKADLNYPSSISDSTYIRTRIFLDQLDIFKINDTATNTQFFFNEMAYDDGTAEMAYGIEGLGVKKVAYKFYIPAKDTLAAIKIHFSNIDNPVYNLIFNLNVWKSVGINNQQERILKTISNLKPQYKDIVNGFYTFGLDTPLEVQDTIYVGWTQTDERNLQIGYDRNSSLGHDKLFIMVNNVWSKSNVVKSGSPMIRLILDGKRDFRPRSSTEEVLWTKEQFSVYPNPASDFVYLESSFLKRHHLIVYDLMGRVKLGGEIKQANKIDVSQLENGIYIYHIENDEGEIMNQGKLQIRK